MQGSPPLVIGDPQLLPQNPNGVKWGEDGRIAIISDEISFIFSYCSNLASMVSPDEATIVQPTMTYAIYCEKGELEKSWYNTIPAQHKQHLSGLDQIESSECIMEPYYRIAEWSPISFAWDGGCLLALLDSRHSLRIYQPPKRREDSSWEVAASVSESLFKYYYSKMLGKDAERRSFKEKNFSTTPLTKAVTPDALKKVSKQRSRRKSDRITPKEQVNISMDVDSDPEADENSLLCSDDWLKLYSQTRIHCLAWFPRIIDQDLALLAIGGHSRISLWGVKGCSADLINRIQVNASPLGIFEEITKSNDNWIQHLQWCTTRNENKENEILSIARSDGAVQLLEVSFKDPTSIKIQPLYYLRSPGSRPALLLSFIFNDQSNFVSVATGGTISMYLLEKSNIVVDNPKPVLSWKAHSSVITSLYPHPWSNFTEKSVFLVTSSFDGTVIEWEIPCNFSANLTETITILEPKQRKILFESSKQGLTGSRCSPYGVALCVQQIQPSLMSDEIMTAHQIYFQSRSHALNFMVPLQSRENVKWDAMDWERAVKFVGFSDPKICSDWIWILREKIEWGDMRSAGGALRDDYLRIGTENCNMALQAIYRVFLSDNFEHSLSEGNMQILRIAHISLMMLLKCFEKIEYIASKLFFEQIRVVRRVLLVGNAEKWLNTSNTNKNLEHYRAAKLLLACYLNENNEEIAASDDEMNSIERKFVQRLCRLITRPPPVFQTLKSKLEKGKLPPDLCSVCRSPVKDSGSWEGINIGENKVKPPLLRACEGKDHVQRICGWSLGVVSSAEGAGAARCPICQMYCNLRGEERASARSYPCPLCAVLLE